MSKKHFMSWSLLTLCLLILAGLFGLPAAQAQEALGAVDTDGKNPATAVAPQTIEAVTGYTFSQDSGTYTALTGDTVFAINGGGGDIDDGISASQTIPFTFNFSGTDFTTYRVSSNGWLGFGAPTSTANFSSLSGSVDNLIAFVNRDLNNVGAVYSNVTEGTAPNRIHKIQATNFYRFNTATMTGNAQIWLYEGSNVIEIHYGAFSNTWTSGTTVQVGLRGTGTGDVRSLSGTGPTAWSAPTVGTSSTATMELALTVTPTSGQIYRWTPPPPSPPGCAVSPSPADAATGVFNNPTLTWAAGTGGAPTSYDVYFGTSATPPFVTNVATPSYAPGSLAYSTTYYWQIIPKNAEGDAVGCAVWSFTTQADPTITTFPYSENFDGSVPGWTLENSNGDAYVWLLQNTYRRGTVGFGAAIRWNPLLAMDDWLFTPPLQLDAGVTYGVRFFYRAASATYPESMRVMWGSANSSAAMTEGPIFDNNNITNTVMQEAIATFTPPTDGVYYVGFHGYSAADMFYLAIDDVTIYDTADSVWEWTGTADTNWHNGANWEGNIVPGELDTVNIPAAPTNQPAIGTSTEASYGRVNNLTIASGAELDLATTHNLRVQGALTNNGTIQQTRFVGGLGLQTFAYITDVPGTTAKYYGASVSNSTATPMGDTTVRVSGNQTGGCTTTPTDALLHRCFSVNPTTPQEAVIRFWFTEAERNGQAASALQVWHYDGPPGQWSPAGTSYLRSESGETCNSGGGMECWVEAWGVTTYSPFGAGSGAVPTAVTLSSLTATSPVPVFLIIVLMVGLTAGATTLLRRRAA